MEEKPAVAHEAVDHGAQPVHHHHSHAATSRHGHGHHLLTVEDLSVSFLMYDEEAAATRAQGDSRADRGRLGRYLDVPQREVEVIRSLSLSVHEGEIVAVVGPNATGKSTLGKLLAGLVKEDGGTVRVEGKKLASGRRRGRIWYIMQDLDSQLFGESVRDELLCGQKATPERTARADEVLDALGLGALADRHPATLSGGQKQRLALGVALMHDASVIVLDEPTSGLDGKSMRSVGRQIEKLAHEGRVILMITHDVECAVATCDRVLHLRDGRVAQDVPLRDAEELLAAMR